MQRVGKITVLFLCIAILVAACGPNLTARKTSLETIHHGARVAVLPFDNFSGREKAGVKVTDYLATLMTGSTRYTIVSYGNTIDMLRRLRVRSSSMITDTQLDSLAAGLGVDFVVTGTVLEFTDFDNTYLGKIPQVSFNTKVVECATHKTIWAGVFNGSGDDSEFLFGVGAVRSVDHLAEAMVSKIVHKIDELFKSR